MLLKMIKVAAYWRKDTIYEDQDQRVRQAFSKWKNCTDPAKNK